MFSFSLGTIHEGCPDLGGRGDSQKQTSADSEETEVSQIWMSAFKKDFHFLLLLFWNTFSPI